MPTENELKYVLRMNCEKEIAKIAKEKMAIHQGYLVSSKGIVLRVRASGTAEGIKYYMTFKYSTKQRVIEVEKKLDKRDFDDLWEACMNKLDKIRYEVKDSNKQVWEIDFFKNHDDQTYFAMAEHEMPEGKAFPDMIPQFITSNLLYAVPLTDTRFASKLLADVRYAKQMYQSFLENRHEQSKQVV